ncbi:MAG: endonuclease domain-containing protein [Candidatus Amesbacteria bacterium]|nr:endonuclease domain-containing protein [Candidatus Amesbacteria bacterium]
MKWRQFHFNNPALKNRRQDLRLKSTLAEKILWERLRRSELGFKFFRQYSVDGYVMDFYCPTKHLAIEIEGSIHKETSVADYDKFRYRYLEAFGVRFLKFSNQQIYEKIGETIESIKSNLHTPS